ncbi:MAG: hypothetical protein NDI73_02210 [Desulfuromonadales bacterium]|nr:hypothetical protein [Desulfuromonadales bacterium]
MNRKSVILAIVLLTATVITANAAVPPPSVNQHLGIPDTTFNNLTETGCRSCHNQSPPIAAVDPTYLPDRHHLLVGTAIPAASDIPYTDADGNGQADSAYGCYNCHQSTYNPVTMSYVLDPNFRDCALCHQQTGTSGGTVHHRGALAQSGDCAACHGSFVDKGLLDTDKDGIIAALDKTEDLNGDGYADGGWIPTYQASLVTPWPSKKPANGPATGTDSRLKNIFGEKQGSCKFCHSNLTGVEGQPVSENSGPFAPVLVYTNSETHHTTGFFEDGTKCQWCHSFAQPNPALNSSPIRTCEICHGIPSLHNIQVDSGTDGIKPGAELRGFGHIGAQWDCDGCHGFDRTTTSAAPASGPVVPGLYHLSASSVQAGNAIELTGTAFINQIQDPMTGAYAITAKSDVVLTDAAGKQIVLSPVNVFNDAIQVIIPADLAAGNYKIAAKKGPKLSNPLNLAVTPKLSVATATTKSYVVTLTGTGFSSYMKAAGSGTSVTANVRVNIGTKYKPVYVTKPVDGLIQSWTDTRIVAKFTTNPTAVNVNTVFGSKLNVPVKRIY